MKITAEMLAMASREISSEELIEFANQTYEMTYLKHKALDLMACIASGTDPIDTILAELTIAVLVGIKVGKKEATTELSQVR